ncbi:MAG: ATP-binding protein [Bacteroidia bacterium]
MEQAFEKQKLADKQSVMTSGDARLLNEVTITANARVISNEISWLNSLLQKRILELDGKTQENISFSDFPPPDIANDPSPYSELIHNQQLSSQERLLLITSLIPHISPETFTSRIRDEQSQLKIKYPKLGGYFDTTFANFVPTLQTVVYLLSGDDMSLMLYNHLFLAESALIREQIITLNIVKTSEDDTNMRNYAVQLAPEFVDYLISGKKPRPDFGHAFPATLITTGLDWEQLVVKPAVFSELHRIMLWEQKGKELLSKTNHKLNSSFTCLFYGPSGSGKTLAVQLLGKTLGIDVFRIDLSMVVSKYVGETEKNLAYLFDRAKGKNWILFFDEADALFGKRTDISDAKDKWANLEMSYLLQRMEEHNGLTILASNLKNNIDTAMSRRFQSVLFFNRPDKRERVQLWKKLLPPPFKYDAKLSFDELGKYELTGGNITNIIKSACLEAVSRDSELIASQDLADAIMREFNKENRFPN